MALLSHVHVSNGGWGNASVVKDCKGRCPSGQCLKRRGAQVSYNSVEDGAQPEVQRVGFTSLGPPGGHWRPGTKASVQHRSRSTRARTRCARPWRRPCSRLLKCLVLSIVRATSSSLHLLPGPGGHFFTGMRRVREYRIDALLPGRRGCGSDFCGEWRCVPVAVWGQAHGTAVGHIIVVA